VIDWRGKRVLVTGAGREIGRAVSTALARKGAEVYLAARNRDALGNVLREIETSGGRAALLPLDLEWPDSLEGGTFYFFERSMPCLKKQNVPFFS
jgi:NAD(P)-dependent dehydrogenase (short-subunit alcohol dehydrogenase family)